MAVYVYCSRLSDGARDLAKAIGTPRLRRFDGMDFWRKGKKVVLKAGDAVVCWGNTLPDVEDVKVLNGIDYQNKLVEAITLKNSKVKTIEVYNGSAGTDGLDKNVWLGRKFDHVGGNDLLVKQRRPDFWAKKEHITQEFRLHIFANKSIRAGLKVHREGFATPHPWVRSFDAGWRVCYDNFASTKPMRVLARKAVAALGLTFGAVDIGMLADNSLIVLEVNRAPGLEGNTITAYADAIKGWANGETDKEE